MKKLIKNKVNIYPTGISVIILFSIIFPLFGGGGIFLMVGAFLNDGTFFGDALGWLPYVAQTIVVFLLGLIAGVGVSIWTFITFCIRRKVTFIDGRLKHRLAGAGALWSDKPIDVKCKDILSYEQGLRKDRKGIIRRATGEILEFTKANGKKFHIVPDIFTKKQRLRIMQEIKNRGGLQDIEIETTLTKEVALDENDVTE